MARSQLQSHGSCELVHSPFARTVSRKTGAPYLATGGGDIDNRAAIFSIAGESAAKVKEPGNVGVHHTLPSVVGGVGGGFSHNDPRIINQAIRRLLEQRMTQLQAVLGKMGIRYVTAGTVSFYRVVFFETLAGALQRRLGSSYEQQVGAEGGKGLCAGKTDSSCAAGYQHRLSRELAGASARVAVVRHRRSQVR